MQFLSCCPRIEGKATFRCGTVSSSKRGAALGSCRTCSSRSARDAPMLVVNKWKKSYREAVDIAADPRRHLRRKSTFTCALSAETKIPGLIGTSPVTSGAKRGPPATNVATSTSPDSRQCPLGCPPRLNLFSPFFISRDCLSISHSPYISNPNQGASFTTSTKTDRSNFPSFIFHSSKNFKLFQNSLSVVKCLFKCLFNLFVDRKIQIIISVIFFFFFF